MQVGSLLDVTGVTRSGLGFDVPNCLADMGGDMAGTCRCSILNFAFFVKFGACPELVEGVGMFTRASACFYPSRASPLDVKGV
jgi:hypothetical protein